MPVQIDGVSFFLLPKPGTQELFVNKKILRNITKRKKVASDVKGKETEEKKTSSIKVTSRKLQNLILSIIHSYYF